jgi:hypothetical protein
MKKVSKFQTSKKTWIVSYIHWSQKFDIIEIQGKTILFVFFRREILTMIHFEVFCPVLPRSVMDEARSPLSNTVVCVPCVTAIDATHVTMHSSMLLYSKATLIWFC